MHLLQRCPVNPFLRKLFLHQGGSAPAAHHPHISPGLIQNGFQTFGIVAMAPGDNYKPGIRIPFDPGKSFGKRHTDHLIRPCRSGIVCKFRPVFQNSNRKSQHFSDPDNRHGHMTGAADNQLRRMAGTLPENLFFFFSLRFHQQGLHALGSIPGIRFFAGKDPLLSRMFSGQNGFHPDILFRLFQFSGKSGIKIIHLSSSFYFPNPQFGNVHTSQFRHRPPSPSKVKSSAVSLSPAAIRGRTRSKIVLLAYITHPGSPMTGTSPA